MRKLCEEVGLPAPGSGPDELKPFPIVYEEIVQAAALAGHDEDWVKTVVSAFATEIDPVDTHRRLMALKADHFLTTNYDLALEQAVPGVDWRQLRNAAPVDETRYSMLRRFVVEGRPIWHLHGDCRKPNTIALGFEHYSGYLQQMRNYMTSGLDYARYKTGALRKRMGSVPADIDSWVDLFFFADLHIVGLGFSFAETHLWWLLTYRARLKIRRRVAVSNRVCFHSRPPEHDDARTNARLGALKSQNVEVEFHGSRNTPYDEYYEMVCQALS